MIHDGQKTTTARGSFLGYLLRSHIEVKNVWILFGFHPNFTGHDDISLT